MPGRLTPIVTEEIYHVFNRGIDHRPTFLDLRELNRAKQIINFYRFADLPIRYSVSLIWAEKRRNELLENLEKSGKQLVEIFSYSLMPNHFHLLLKQKIEKGIAKFMSNFQNSYTRYFNTKHKRTGPLFLDQFKAVRMETDEQILHVSRYIHLNPYTSYIVKTIEKLKEYPWSSLPEFISNRKGFCQTGEIISYFKQKSAFEKFIFDQANYQKHLGAIKHLIFEENP